MKTPTLSLLSTVSVLVAALGALPLPAADTAVPVLSIRATVPATREPLCDPALCDAALPAPGVFTITRQGGDLNRELSVLLRYEGTAVKGTDYAALPDTIHFGIGVASIQLFVEAAFDQVTEGPETVVATVLPDPSLGPVERYRVDPAQNVARVVIRETADSSATLVLTAPKEGAVIPLGEPIVIMATAIDPDGAMTRVEFFDAGQKIGESEILFFRQPDPGTPIYHEFVWKGASAGAHELTARALDSHGNPVISPPVSIFVGVGQPTVSIRATQPATSEGCPVCRVAPGAFTISRTGPTNDPLHVWYFLHGTARNGVDYLELSGDALIPAGRESIDVLVFATIDNIREGNETVVARLQYPEVAILIFPPPPPPYRIDPNHAEATVVINDYPFIPPADAVVSIVATDPMAREGSISNPIAKTASFTITRSGPTNEALAVRYQATGTASPGVDYAPLASPLLIPAGARRAPLVITPINGSVQEPIETVIITLLPDDAAAAAYELGQPRHAAALLLDHDTPRPPCLRLPDGLFNLCLAGVTNRCVRVEATRDFVAWSPLGTILVNQAVALFVDPDTPQMAHRFYRIVPVSCDP